jgi:hypothetical protein
VTIHVTAEDIADRERNQCVGCPVWAAMTRALPGANVLVWARRAVVDGRPYPLPEDVWARLFKYDTTGEMEPFSFTLEVTC